MKKFVLVIGAFLSLTFGSLPAWAQPKKILVVLSGVDYVSLENGRPHSTGFFLNELMKPLKGLIEQGYEPVFANPTGLTPAMDISSDKSRWFSSPKEHDDIKILLDSLSGFKNPIKLEDLVESETLSQFSGLFLPGGHAPMEDLYRDKNLGRILRFFHEKHLPIALICHAPVALLAAMDGPHTQENEADVFVQALQQLRFLDRYPTLQGTLDPAGTHRALAEHQIEDLSRSWIFRDITLTVFSNAEEKVEETNGDLGGTLKFYVADALQRAGAEVRHADEPWNSHVEVSHNVLTGQNPMSDGDFTDLFIQRLRAEPWFQRHGVDFTDSTSSLSEGVTYQVAKSDLKTGYTTFFVGDHSGDSTEVFHKRLLHHVRLTMNGLGPLGLHGYWFATDGQTEIAILNWESKEAMESAFQTSAGLAVQKDAGEFLRPKYWGPLRADLLNEITKYSKGLRGE